MSRVNPFLLIEYLCGIITGHSAYNIYMDTKMRVAPIDVRTRISEDVIEEIARQIAAEFQPQKIILFGSYAYGNPKPESDVDLLIVMETSQRGISQALKIRQAINPLFGLDLVVYTPSDLKQRLEWGDAFLLEVLARGKVLYESVDA